MQGLKKFVFRFVLLALVLVIVGFVLQYYSFVFSKSVRGQVLNIERVTQIAAIAGTGALAPEQMYSFSVAVKNDQGEIFTASSEDRQWAVVQKGNCVEAKYFPYPPWDLEKAGTYHNARLIKMFECPQR